MARLYTGIGDEGYTQNLKGVRVSKTDRMIELIGTLDEVSCLLGVAKAHTKERGLVYDIERLQKELISVMGELSGGEAFVSEETVVAVEKEANRYCTHFCGFSLSGKNATSAFLDLARATVRRAERVAAKLLQEEKIRKATYIYLNRLSDLLYAMSRYAEKE